MEYIDIRLLKYCNLFHFIPALQFAACGFMHPENSYSSRFRIRML